MGGPRAVRATVVRQVACPVTQSGEGRLGAGGRGERKQTQSILPLSLVRALGFRRFYDLLHLLLHVGNALRDGRGRSKCVRDTAIHPRSSARPASSREVYRRRRPGRRWYRSCSIPAASLLRMPWRHGDDAGADMARARMVRANGMMRSWGLRVARFPVAGGLRCCRHTRLGRTRVVRGGGYVRGGTRRATVTTSGAPELERIPRCDGLAQA